MADLTAEQQLDIIARAWGKQDGYCFFPYISGKALNKEERIRSYDEGPAFHWPHDRPAILKRMKAHVGDDLYWCPSLFEAKRRQLEVAMDEHALWADLDAVDPHTIDDYPPTIAWETSPGRYQAIWLVMSGDLQGASWQGGENQRMTYHLGADVGGWDTTQLLRIPGWANHKPEYREKNGGKPVAGRLLWKNGRRYLVDDFEDLPEVPKQGEFEDILEDQIEAIDVKKVWGSVRLKLPVKAREMYASREVTGDRSANLWWLMRCLADAGCTAVEIVAILQNTVWNKFAGRGDELKRLTIEAGKAIAARSDDVEKAIEKEREEKPKPGKLSELVRNVKPPRWLIEGIWTEGACGFIAGQPKSFKTWCGLDMALSVSSGMMFLDSFRVSRPGPVLYIQEEDGLPMVAARYNKIWPSKKSDQMVAEGGEVFWLPPREMADSPIAACIGYGFVVSDPGWQAWLDEILEEGFEGEPYRMVIMDPLMMIAGDVQENQAQDMTERLFKPLKQLSRKHDVAIPIVHHMRKQGNQTNGPPIRGGQLMLGSVANHAWAEDALYITLRRGGVHVELESKTAPSTQFEIRNIRNTKWEPRPTELKGLLDESIGEGDDAGSQPKSAKERGKTNGRSSPVVAALASLGEGSFTVAEIMDACPNTGRSSIYQQLKRADSAGKVIHDGNKWRIA